MIIATKFIQGGKLKPVLCLPVSKPQKHQKHPLLNDKMSRKSLTINEPKHTFDSDSITTPDVVEDEPPLPEPSFIPYRAFINHVDGYNAKYITAYITDQIFGASKLNRGPDEGAGEEEEEEQAPKPQVMKIPEDNYEFIGTVSQRQGKKTEDILYIVDEKNAETFREEILKCGFIIYDISQDPNEIPKALAALDIIEEELEEIKAVGPKTFGRFDEIKVFILISTVMTWALTKPLSRNDPDLPFSEVDYKKRRPHPNYKDHFACEREVMKRGQKYSDKLKTYVVCSGIPYGQEEQNFEYFFKMAWYGEEALPLFIPGNNRVPLIYIRDLAKVLHGLMENIPLKPQYILAVEQTPSTLKQIIKSLAKTMGNGKTVYVSSAEAFLYKDLNQEIFDRFTVNLAMEPVFIVENLQVQWTYEAPLPENMYKIIEEFKTARGLKPIKIVLHGPPASGKTTMAKQLCEHYGIRYVSVASMIEEYLTELKESLIKEELLPFEVEKKEILGEGEEEEVEEEEDNTAAITEQIREIELLLERDGPFPDDIVIGIMRKYLAKNYCQSRGYVLDDYPRTIQQGLELFGQAGEGAGGEGGGEGGSGGDDLSKILPDLVVSLEATDEFLCERMWKLKEEEIHGTIYDEENMQRRLEEYREINTEDNTILNFFDELELDMWVVDVNEMNQEQLDPFNCLKVKLGSPIGFGLSAEEQQELLDLEEAEQRLAAEKAALKEKQKEQQAVVDYKNKMESWSETLQKLQMEEEKIVIAQSEPLRHYLMKFVFPTLTKGLIELAKTKPDDPVDFLAEFLFKQNPEGRIFDPSFTEHEEYLYSEFKRDIEAIIMTRPEFEQ